MQTNGLHAIQHVRNLPPGFQLPDKPNAEGMTTCNILQTLARLRDMGIHMSNSLSSTYHVPVSICIQVIITMYVWGIRTSTWHTTPPPELGCPKISRPSCDDAPLLCPFSDASLLTVIILRPGTWYFTVAMALPA
jgi:hypothetical protein